jgi:uncharacterized protein (TIGR00369 family)
MTSDNWTEQGHTAAAGIGKPGVTPLEQVRNTSGLEFLQGMLDGRFPPPPIASANDMILYRVELGVAIFQGTPGFRFYNPLGTVHGGWISTLLDSCMGCAIHTRLEPGQAFTTAELKINFVRPIFEKTGPLRAEGRVIHFGRQIATSEGKLVDESGKLYAHGTTTCLIFPMPA